MQLTFRHHSSLWRHERTHSEVKCMKVNYVICPLFILDFFNFMKEIILKKKSYVCTQSGKFFRHHSFLGVPERTHTGENANNIAFCFSSSCWKETSVKVNNVLNPSNFSSSLQVHGRTYWRIILWLCKNDDSFSFSSSLWKHKRDSHWEKTLWM